jgi:hypothetical protein
MARYAFDDLRLRNGVILAKEETYAKGIQKIFADEFQRKGGRIVETIEFPDNTSDFAALADRAATLKPDFVYVAAYAGEGSRAIQELRNHQFTGLILTTSSFAAARRSPRRRCAELVISPSSPETGATCPQGAAFVKAFRSATVSPDLYAAHGFDALNVVFGLPPGRHLDLFLERDARCARCQRRGTPVRRGGRCRSSRTSTSCAAARRDIEKAQEQILKAREEMKRLQDELDRLRQGGS